jgi:hypothetical protein
MKATGITMSGNHPRLILDKQKTMTRRTWGLEEINKKPDEWKFKYMKGAIAYFERHSEIDAVNVLPVKCPYGGVGDLLWIKEAYAIRYDGKQILYRADYLSICEALELEEFSKRWGLPLPQIKWSYPRFMPRARCRIQVPITGLRPERLWDINPNDVKAEGVEAVWGGIGNYIDHYIQAFANLWDSINGKRYPWSGNWWVWVISF